MKKTIAGISAAAVLALGSQIQVNPSPLTVNEWGAMSSLYNYEIQQVVKTNGSFTVSNFKDITDLNKEIRKRIPTEQVIIDGVTSTPQQYQIFRDNMLKKTEKKTILQAITGQ